MRAKDKLTLFILLWGAAIIIWGIVSTHYHEQGHAAIFRYYGCREPKIHHNWIRMWGEPPAYTICEDRMLMSGMEEIQLHALLEVQDVRIATDNLTLWLFGLVTGICGVLFTSKEELYG